MPDQTRAPRPDTTVSGPSGRVGKTGGLGSALSPLAGVGRAIEGLARPRSNRLFPTSGAGGLVGEAPAGAAHLVTTVAVWGEGSIFASYVR